MENKKLTYKYIARIPACKETQQKQLFVLRKKETIQSWEHYHCVVLFKQLWHGEKKWCWSEMTLTKDILDKNKRHGSVSIDEADLITMY